jgi:Flp pilus assembly protein TadG
MKPPAYRRFHSPLPARRERGVTMVLVAIAMVAIIAMAALSIDVITLYLAREEAQRSADEAALAAARVIALSGITGDPSNATASWPPICGGATSAATQAAIAVAMQSSVGGTVITAPTVTYSVGTSAPNTDCTAVTGGFGINPIVTVSVQRTSLPTFFSRIWGNSGNSVSATAQAEAFNSSNSDSVPGAGGNVVPVQPSCVKPWIVPNRDPLNPDDTCGQGGSGKACNPFVSTADGSIIKKGISLNGTNATGVIGERFWLNPDCVHTGSACTLRQNPPAGNYWTAGINTWVKKPPSLEYLPGEAPITNPVAVPLCANSGSVYEAAVGGCDQSTIYQCGVQSSAAAPPVVVDLSENPGAGTNDTMNGVTCMIHEGSSTDAQPDGQDTLNTSAYPFQILSGTSSPLNGAGLAPGSAITSSNSIVSLPIYDDTNPTKITTPGTTNVTIVGFLQVFINSVDQWGNLDVTVLNVSGCGNGTGTAVSATTITGTSSVPIRLITPP